MAHIVAKLPREIQEKTLSKVSPLDLLPLVQHLPDSSLGPALQARFEEPCRQNDLLPTDGERTPWADLFARFISDIQDKRYHADFWENVKGKPHCLRANGTVSGKCLYFLNEAESKETDRMIVHFTLKQPRQRKLDRPRRTQMLQRELDDDDIPVYRFVLGNPHDLALAGEDIESHEIKVECNIWSSAFAFDEQDTLYYILGKVDHATIFRRSLQRTEESEVVLSLPGTCHYALMGVHGDQLFILFITPDGERLYYYNVKTKVLLHTDDMEEIVPMNLIQVHKNCAFFRQAAFASLQYTVGSNGLEKHVYQWYQKRSLNAYTHIVLIHEAEGTYTLYAISYLDDSVKEHVVLEGIKLAIDTTIVVYTDTLFGMLVSTTRYIWMEEEPGVKPRLLHKYETSTEGRPKRHQASSSSSYQP